MKNVHPLLRQCEDAACVVNSHGRLLGANVRFCRLFGFGEGEAEWHYFCDLYRHEAEWKAFQGQSVAPGEERHYVARLRNRKGRSFKCCIARVASLDEQGRLVYVNTILKLAQASELAPVRVPGVAVAAQIFFTVCTACHRVRDAEGRWVEGDAPVSPRRMTRYADYCPDCAARLFPGVFERQAEAYPLEEERVAAVR